MRFCFPFLIFIIATFNCAAQASSDFFTLYKTPELGIMKGFKASSLCNVADETAHYLTEYSEDKFAVHAGKVFDRSVTLPRVKQTLGFICQTYREDVRAKRNSRMHSEMFLR